MREPPAEQALHPVTLRFADAEAERRIRASQFEASYHLYVGIMGCVLIMHMWLPTVHEKARMMSAIYVPTVSIALVGRVALSRLEDQARAHEYCCWM